MYKDNFGSWRDLTSGLSTHQSVLKASAAVRASSAVLNFLPNPRQSVFPDSLIINSVSPLYKSSDFHKAMMPINTGTFHKGFNDAVTLSSLSLKYKDLLASSRLFDSLNIIDRHRNSIFDIMQKHSLINKIPNSMFMAFDTALSRTIDRSIKKEDYESFKVIDEVFDELASVISVDIHSVSSLEALMDRANTITKRLRDKTDIFLEKDIVVLINRAIHFIVTVYTLYCIYLSLSQTEQNTLITNESINESIKAKMQIYFDSTRMQLREELKGKMVLVGSNAVSVNHSKVYHKASKNNKAVGVVIKGQIVTVVSINRKWMMICFENNEGAPVSGWVIKEDFLVNE